MHISLDDGQKIAQITFYSVAVVVTILTFLRAKKTLLSSVNTEYHKKVIERLDALSKTLLDEYNPDSPNYWARKSSVEDAVQNINEEFLRYKVEILRAGEFEPPILTNPVGERLSRLVTEIKSDPFIPKEIRDTAVDLLGNRADVIDAAHIGQLERYCDELAKGKYQGDALEATEHIVHNRVVDELNQHGCGVVKIEEEVHKLRLAIQEYFQEFHP